MGGRGASSGRTRKPVNIGAATGELKGTSASQFSNKKEFESFLNDLPEKATVSYEINGKKVAWKKERGGMWVAQHRYQSRDTSLMLNDTNKITTKVDVTLPRKRTKVK